MIFTKSKYLFTKEVLVVLLASVLNFFATMTWVTITTFDKIEKEKVVLEHSFKNSYHSMSKDLKEVEELKKFKKTVEKRDSSFEELKKALARNE